MTTPDCEVVITLVDGDAREVSRTFRSGGLHAPFSVGLRGEWIVSAEGVASVHLWLRFDGERLYVASAGADAMTYLQDLRIGDTWHEVADRSELRFGQARMRVFSRPAEPWASVAPPAQAAARVEPRRSSSPSRVEPRQLSPIERAAALPLPPFFRDRLRAGSEPSPAAPEARRARSQPPPRTPLREVPGAAGRASKAMLWVGLGMAAVGALLFILLGATGFGRHADVRTRPAASAAILPPASARVGERPSSALASTPFPAVEAAATALPAIAEISPVTKSLGETPPRAPYRQNIADRPVPRIGEEPWMISEEWRSHHERQLHAPNRARAKVVFLGDSITEGWGASTAYRDSFGKYTPLNLGLAGDFTQNILWRIEHGALTGTNPEVVVLMVGVNNLAGGFSPQETVAGIRAILVAVQAQLPATRVLLLAILPARQNPNDPLRQRIVEANRLLTSVPAPARVSVHDVGAALLEPDGTLSKSTLGDFQHPTAAGYKLLSEAVAPLIDALIGRAAE